MKEQKQTCNTKILQNTLITFYKNVKMQKKIKKQNPEEFQKQLREERARRHKLEEAFEKIRKMKGLLQADKAKLAAKAIRGDEE